MKTYNDYLKEVEMMALAGHNRADVIKTMRILYLFNDGDLDMTDELGILIIELSNGKYDALFTQ